MSDWTADREQQLRDDWAAGLPGSAIAARLAVTRAMIMGKVRRLKLAARREKTWKTGRPVEVVRARPMPHGVIPPTVWKTLGDLEHGECRWPLGSSDFVFCAMPADHGLPYCAVHSRVAYQPGHERRIREAA